MMIVYALEAVGHPPLESAQPPPPRTLLAGQVTIGRSVRSRTERSRHVPRPLQRSFALTLDLYRSGRLPLDRLITHRMPLEDVQRGIDLLLSGEAIRAVVDLNGKGA